MLFIFMQVFDDILIDDPNLGFWERDVIEFFFDPDNSKNPHSTGLDNQDEHLTFPFRSQPVSTGISDVSKIEYVQKQTDLGWILEVAIPFAELSINTALLCNYYFGFEVYYNDNDDGVSREHFTRWRSTYIRSWENPSSWGTVRLIDKIVSEDLEIPKTKTALHIDGLQEQAWLGIPHISQNFYNAFYDGKDPRLILSNYGDAQFDCRLAWDDKWLYGMVEALDDDLSNRNQRFQIVDGIELFFEKNDVPHHLVFPLSGLLVVESSTLSAESIQYEFSAADRSTWLLEFAIPLVDLQISPSQGEMFRFDILQNDCDADYFEHTAHWWSHQPDKNDVN